MPPKVAPPAEPDFASIAVVDLDMALDLLRDYRKKGYHFLAQLQPSMATGFIDVWLLEKAA